MRGIKKEFCLHCLGGQDLCSWQISRIAKASGLNGGKWPSEWADKPLRGLRNMGFVELTGERSESGRRIHRITDAGSSALASHKTTRKTGA